jgi:hypothetical protein
MLPINSLPVHESELATFWFDENGYLFARSKPTVRTIENQKATYALIREISGGKKVCIVGVTASTPGSDQISPEIAAYMAAQMPLLFHAMAVVAVNAEQAAPARKFINLQDQPVPICICQSVEGALEWLQQFPS